MLISVQSLLPSPASSNLPLPPHHPQALHIAGICHLAANLGKKMCAVNHSLRTLCRADPGQMIQGDQTTSPKHPRSPIQSRLFVFLEALFFFFLNETREQLKISQGGN